MYVENPLHDIMIAEPMLMTVPNLSSNVFKRRIVPIGGELLKIVGIYDVIPTLFRYTRHVFPGKLHIRQE